MSKAKCYCLCTDDIWVLQQQKYLGCFDDYHCGREDHDCHEDRYDPGSPDVWGVHGV